MTNSPPGFLSVTVKSKKKELAACYFRTVYYRRRYDA